MFFLFSNQCFCLGQFNELVFPEPASHLLSLVREWHGRELAHREKTGTDQRHRKQFSISMRSSAGLFSFHGDIFLVGKPFLIFKKCTPKSFPSILVSFRGKDFTAVIEWLCVALGQHLSLYRSPPSQWLRVVVSCTPLQNRLDKEGDMSLRCEKTQARNQTVFKIPVIGKLCDLEQVS